MADERIRGGEITFPPISIDKTGQYKYIVRETTPSGGGWIAEERSYRVNATVTDGGDGKLDAAIEYVDEYPEFVNTFAPEPCGVQIIAHADTVGAPLYNSARVGMRPASGSIRSSSTIRAASASVGASAPVAASAPSA
ncbi:MAG: hypothetical protein LBB86_02720, partial [Oscillospiraceae bacterium]|nr:hypothetical protein [Oscillospiraceae bacterium]